MRKKDVDGLRSCSTCGGTFPANSEHFYRRRTGSLSSECRECFRRRSSRNQKTRHRAGGIDYHLSYILRGARQRAKKSGIVCEINADFLRDLLGKQGGRCAISKIKLTFEKGQGHVSTNASVDRINPARGYTEDNVQLVAHQVNTMKSNLSIDQFKDWCKLVLEGD